MQICWDNLNDIRLNKNGNFINLKNKNMMNYIEKCSNCGEPFLAYRSQIKNKVIFCSKKCSNLINAKKVKHTEESRKKISNHSKLRFKNKENHPNWKGGKLLYYNTYAQQLSWCESVRRNKDNSDILEVKCAYCGKWYIPTISSIINRINSIKGRSRGEGRLYCSDECKRECPIYNQKKWPKSFKTAT